MNVAGTTVKQSPLYEYPGTISIVFVIVVVFVFILLNGLLNHRTYEFLSIVMLGLIGVYFLYNTYISYINNTDLTGEQMVLIAAVGCAAVIYYASLQPKNSSYIRTIKPETHVTYLKYHGPEGMFASTKKNY
jgi:hypothetical protein